MGSLSSCGSHPAFAFCLVDFCFFAVVSSRSRLLGSQRFKNKRDQALKRPRWTTVLFLLFYSLVDCSVSALEQNHM